MNAKRMIALHVNAGNLYGGIETLLITVARQRALCSDVEQHFALFFEGRHSEELRGAGVPVHLLGGARISRPWTIWRARCRLRRLLAEYPFDVLLTHGCWNHALVAPEARRRGVPVVFWGHMIESGNHLVQRWASWSPPDLILANSRVTQASVTAHLFPKARSEVLYLPVAPPVLPDREAARREVRRELGTAEDAVVVVTVCRLQEWKGHSVLLEALSGLVSRPGWECWVAGGAQRPEEEQYLARLLQQAGRLGIGDRVRFLGHRADVARVLAAADVHCQPNTSPEPFGIAFIEALYAGLPVVTSAIGGALEIIDDTCGVLVPAGDVPRLAVALEKLLASSEERARLGAHGPSRAARLCDPGSRLLELRDMLGETRDRAARARG
jgi:glycosyltransferase involved in cell wall biosynthesis